MGSVTDVTELPAKYKELEEKVDKIKALHESFLRVSRNYTLPHYDYEPLLSESAYDFATTVSDRVSTLVSSASGTPATRDASQPKDEIPRSLAHAFAKAATANADAVGSEEPLGVALKKFAATEERVGAARLRLDAEATAKFHQPFSTTLNQLILHAMKARRNVQAVRLNYDAARAKLKAARPEREEAARQEMEATEDEFVAVVDDAMGKMTAVVESPEPLKNLADLVAAQLKYFKEAHEALAELSPEIDELQVTNEALLRHPSS
ncbi:BAR domain-containing family protein [Zopfochytrium polystomum]|nr:BAR domain-containing family protein [Zopfochytrium polystomum]KAI9355640.1 BAR domain-containing family protein [Zopfochytrium polystomum]